MEAKTTTMAIPKLNFIGIIMPDLPSFRNLARRGENDFGVALIRSDGACDGDALSVVVGEVAEFGDVVGEDYGREGAGLVALAEIEEDSAARSGV